MSNQIKATLQEADFAPEGTDVDVDYITLTFRVPDTTKAVHGEWTLSYPSEKGD